MIDKMGCKSEKYEVSNTTPPLDSADSKHPVVLAFDVYNMADTGGVSKTLNSIRSDSDHVPITCYDVDLIAESRGAYETYQGGAIVANSLKASDYKGSQVVCFRKTAHPMTPWGGARMGENERG